MITLVAGIRVGHVTDRAGVTGCTVVLCPPGTNGSVDVKGGAPGTRETDAIRPGVVSIPHGFGHDAPDVRMRVAREYAGVNSNVLTDEELVDPISGNAVLNGIPVSVSRA